MVIGRMISRSFCWAIMKKMTKKWDLETSNTETKLKIEIYVKNWAKQVMLKILTMVKVNGQRFDQSQVNKWRVLTWQCDVTLGLTWQYAKWSRRMGMCGNWCVRRVEVRKGYWRWVATRAHEVENSVGACDVVSGRSWLGFALDWLFCLPMPFLWLLNEQNVDIWELQVLWAWRGWLASDSDYWMKARAAEERQRCP